MIIIRNRLLPFGKRFIAINIFGILFAKTDLTPQLINHERIHTRQMLETAFVGFYIFYLVEWLVRLVMLRDSYKAYRAVSYEREAYANSADPAYLQRRPFWNFLRYL